MTILQFKYSFCLLCPPLSCCASSWKTKEEEQLVLTPFSTALWHYRLSGSNVKPQRYTIHTSPWCTVEGSNYFSTAINKNNSQYQLSVLWHSLGCGEQWERSSAKTLSKQSTFPLSHVSLRAKRPVTRASVLTPARSCAGLIKVTVPQTCRDAGEGCCHPACPTDGNLVRAARRVAGWWGRPLPACHSVLHWMTQQPIRKGTDFKGH